MLSGSVCIGVGDRGVGGGGGEGGSEVSPGRWSSCQIPETPCQKKLKVGNSSYFNIVQLIFLLFVELRFGCIFQHLLVTHNMVWQMEIPTAPMVL